MSTTFPGSACVGRVIDGRFKLLRRLGGTEHSSVFLTELAGDPPRRAAAKFVAPDDARNAEWAAARTLSHPHVIRLFAFGQCELDGTPLEYAVTEYAEEVLSDILAERPLTAAETAEMLPAIMDALSYLHDRGLVHGGLASSNILAVGDRLKLSVDSIRAAGKPGRRRLSTGDFDAPELATGAISPAMDVWSVGVVVVNVLTQQMPAWDRAGGWEPIIPASVPEPFAGIARECLRVDPARRCTLAEVKARLTGGANAAPPPTPTPAPAPAVAGKRKTAWKVPAAIAAVTVVLAGVLIAAVELSSHRSQPAPTIATQESAEAPSSPAAQPPPAEAQAGRTETAKGGVIHQVMPAVPEAAMGTIHGHFKVGIRVEVDADGIVSNAAIDSEGPSRYFAEFALKAAQQWKFKPAEKDGRPLASAWKLEFVFGRAGATVTPAEVEP